MNIRLLSNRVLIKPIIKDETTISGIIIIEHTKEKINKGEVISIGIGTKDEEMVVSVGDTILYDRYHTQEVELDDINYLIIKQSDILAII